MAIVKNGHPANVGKTVTCLELLPAGSLVEGLAPGVSQQFAESDGPLWRIDRQMVYAYRYVHVVPDSALLPIRPDAEQLGLEHQTAENC